MLDVLRERNDWKFFGSLHHADPWMAVAWWIVLVLRGVLPALAAIVTGMLVGAVQRGDNLVPLLFAMGAVFLPLQVLPGDSPGHRHEPRKQDRVVAVRPSDRGVRSAAGNGSSRKPQAHKRPDDGARLRSGDHRPAHVDLDGFHRERIGRDGGRAGRRHRAVRLLMVGSTGACGSVARDSLAVARERASGAIVIPKKSGPPRAMPTTPIGWPSKPRAAKELRLFGLANWVVDRFRSQRKRLFELRWEATRLRERPVLWSVLLVVARRISWCLPPSRCQPSTERSRLAPW